MFVQILLMNLTYYGRVSLLTVPLTGYCAKSLLRQSHVLVSQPLLKIRGANLKLKNLHLIANISSGILKALIQSISRIFSAKYTRSEHKFRFTLKTTLRSCVLSFDHICSCHVLNSSLNEQVHTPLVKLYFSIDPLYKMNLSFVSTL